MIITRKRTSKYQIERNVGNVCRICRRARTRRTYCSGSDSENVDENDGTGFYRIPHGNRNGR